jgi:hypothetical protein
MKESEIKVLLELNENLQTVIQDKYNQIQQFENEISLLKSKINEITNLISDGSFQTAETLMDTESFIKNHENTSFTNLNYTRKLFSKNDQLLATVKFQDSIIFIRLIIPKITKLTQTSYMTNFVKPVLVNLKRIENDLMQETTVFKDNSEEYVDSITLKNIKSFESFDLIVKNIEKLIGID